MTTPNLNDFRTIARDATDDELAEIIAHCKEEPDPFIRIDVTGIYADEQERRAKRDAEAHYWEQRYGSKH